MGRVSENDDDNDTGTGGGVKGQSPQDHGATGDNDAEKGNYDHGAANDKQAAENNGDNQGQGKDNDSGGWWDKAKEAMSPVIDAIDSVMSSLNESVKDFGAKSGLNKSVRDFGVASGLVDYNHAAELADKARAGTMSPAEYEVARGMVSGANAEMANQTIGSIAPGVKGLLASKAIDLAAPTAQHQDYGYTVGRRETAPGMIGSAVNTAAGILGGPVGKFASSAGIAAYNSRDIRDLAEAANISTANEPTKQRDNDYKAPEQQEQPSIYEAAKAAMAGTNQYQDFSKYYTNRIANRTNS